MNRFSMAVGALALLASFQSAADIKFNGFASIRGVNVSSEGEAPFGAYREGNFDFKAETLFGLQARADLSEGLSATVQFMAEGSNEFEVEARWAYLTYELSDTHRLSVGRFANPIFFQSEYEKVGYAHNFARLPQSVYIGFDFATIEGATIDSSFFIGDYTLDTKVLFGNWNGSAFFTATGKDETFGLNDVMSLRATLAGDWWKVYAGGFTAQMDGGSVDQAIVDIFAAQGIAAAQGLGATEADITRFKNQVTWDGKDGLYWYAGFNLDYNNFIFEYEYADYGVKDATDGVNEVWYAAIGYRFEKTVVTIHTEEMMQEEDYSFLNGTTNPALVQTGQGIMNALTFREFEGSGITVRYDFHPSAALKVDYFSGEDTRPSVGDYKYVSIGVDLVF